MLLSIAYCLEVFKSKLHSENNKEVSSINSVFEYMAHCSNIMR